MQPMMRWRAPTPLLLCLLLSLATACMADPAYPRDRSVGVGGPAPELALESLDGRQVSLSQYRGSVVLVNFWATWCGPCNSEIPALEAAYRANKDRGFVILGVDVGDTPQAVQAFVSNKGISYPVLLDEGGRMLVRYGGLGVPMSALVDQDGIIRERHVGGISKAKLESYLEKHLRNR